MSLTELLARVDWSGVVPYPCFSGPRLFIDGRQSVSSWIGSGNNYWFRMIDEAISLDVRPQSPAIARWRQWMIEQIAKAQR